LQQYKSMNITESGTTSSSTSTPTQGNFSESYTTDYVSSTTYKVTLSFTASSTGSTATSLTYVAYILKDGTLSALEISVSGQNENLTGSEVSGEAAGIFAGFILQIQYASNLGALTSVAQFHSTGTSSVTIGSNTFKVTNYAANSLPETITNCDGSTSNLSAFSLAVGTPSGATIPLITSAHINETTTEANGSTETSDVTIQVTAFTLA
jgi:hypothetical protein